MRPGRAADHSSPSSAAVMEEWSYTSTHPLGHTGPVTGHFTFTFYSVYVKQVARFQFSYRLQNYGEVKLALCPADREFESLHKTNDSLLYRQIYVHKKL